MAQGSAQNFNIFAIAQGGRLQFEAIILAASLKHSSPGLNARLYFGEPQPGPRWERNPGINNGEVRTLLKELGAEIVPFESRHFGSEYPYGNKIEGLMALPKGEPFVFFDTDTLFTGDLSRVPFDFSRPSASMKREGTWPVIELYGPGYAATWKSLYDRFGLDFESSLDLTQPDEYWERYSYFNAGYFYYRCPHEFGQKFLEYALEIRDNPPEELICQSLDPWLDQVALPLVIHALGGGRDVLPSGLLDGEVTCHWRLMPLLYARESDEVVRVLEEVVAPNRIKKVLKQYEPFKKMIYQARGHKVRALFDRDDLPTKEQKIRNIIKSNKLWMR
ncbi:MAG: hypothetical protein KDA67_03320 [Rhodobacteraceae bacterium]|nr:hypothetical protein [Paracoccaceae bacterium]